MSGADESSKGIGRPFKDSRILRTVEPTTSPQLTLFVEGTPVKGIVTHGDTGMARRRLAMSSSESLMSVARALFSGKTRLRSEKTLLGLGGDSEETSRSLVTLSCPSDSGRVALALTIGEKDCSCL